MRPGARPLGHEALGPRISRRSLLAAATLVGGVGGAGALAGCQDAALPGEGATTGPDDTAVTWQSWSNGLAEGEQHRRFSQAYQKKTGVKVSYQIVAGDYVARMLKQVKDDTVPDAFYVGDTSLSVLIDRGAVEPLDDFLAGGEAGISFADTYRGLSQWCKGTDGKVYAVPVDCNPKVMWFNKVVLKAAGVTTDPASAFEDGTWTQDACGEMFTEITASGKTAAVIEDNWFDTLSWLTTFGGTAFDDVGKAIFDTDEKAVSAGGWLLDQLKSGNIAYGGALRRGQSPVSLFYEGALGTLGYGRWELPNIARLPRSRVDYDIAPLPSADGGTVGPVGVYSAAMAVNVSAKNKDGAERFLAYYCGPEGMTSRLTVDGTLGVAVPSRPGLDQTVTDGNDPLHAEVFVAAARNGYSTPLSLARDPVKYAKLGAMLDSMLMPAALKGLTAATFLSTYASYLNA